ncbi:dimethylarginine dimethylaminohydrolase family protein [Phenylobacterium sp.]|jgi:N-dimethylarginine dimethylaminohydrolase|uniref:dimethylarginine dimethylaminohydrolase family protein n=1 Tax=Phenylobacterium sp. TaxID=1871053 RepID=UPI002F4181FE
MPPHFLMTDPAAFEVRYQINPWMRPDAWRADPEGGLARAHAASTALREALEAEDATVELIPAAAGLPDLVFPANAGVVLDGVVLPARFRHPERRGEEAPFHAAFEALRRRGVVRRIVDLPEGLFQEGAGDAIWDLGRQHFWSGWGPRSDHAASRAIAAAFGQTVVPLELATPQFYHLDTCFCPLSGGEVLYYPPAFTPGGLAAIRAHVAPEMRLEAGADDAAAFCVNAVNIGRAIVMARPPETLRRRLEARGYRVVAIDLSPFMLSGGAAYCMTLRLDRASVPAAVHATQALEGAL